MTTDTARAVSRDSGRRRAFGITFMIVILVGMTAHLYRAAPAVVAPDILAELDIGTAWVAYITSGFFVAAVLTQIPAGMIFDTFGLRRTIPTLLLLATAAALVFCTARSGAALMAGRILMGMGCGSVIMGGVVLCARWFGPARFASVVGVVLGISQLGNVASTAPHGLRFGGDRLARRVPGAGRDLGRACRDLLHLHPRRSAGRERAARAACSRSSAAAGRS